MLRLRLIVVVLLLAVTFPLLAKDKKKDKGLPKFIVDGRFVYVTREAGPDGASLSTAQDYIAERAVSDELRKWGRYTVVFSPDQADFIVAFRLAQSSPQPGVKPARPNNGGVSPPYLSAEFGPSNDMLSVYSPANGTNSSPLWLKTQKDGLSGQVPLLQVFRKDVEESAKQQGP
jgi:hypothetical protein